ncbi:MAG: gamma-glutamyltransferase family protein [Alphaproteobacteria bacterium]|nr:gamma-glutamyltransferase family protein [Alphaproteobacteria bacterium]
MRVLEAGGNAFDACVAAGFALQVVEPHQAGLGGEVVVLAARAKETVPHVICGQGVAPAAATIARYRAFGLEAVPADGPLSAVVPGALDGWLVLLRDFGTQSLADILTPIIPYASAGFPVHPNFRDDIVRSESRLREWPDSAALYLRHGQLPELGSLFCNLELARTYDRLLRAAASAGTDRDRQIDAARRAFYSGFVADEIDTFSKRTFPDQNGVPREGVVCGTDLANWHATVEVPVSLRYGDFQVFKPGFWSQGPVALETLGILEHCAVGEMDPFGDEYVHTFAEAMKLALANREAWYGDNVPDGISRDALLASNCLMQRRALISGAASHDFVPGSIGDTPIRLPTYKTARAGLGGHARRRHAPVLPGRDTCHIDVIDRHGNVASATPSGGWPGGNPTIPSLGFALNTRLQMCWLQDGLASSLMPGTRPRTTLSPTIAFRDDGARLSFGCRGSDMQDQWSLQFFLRFAELGWDLSDAVERAHFHVEHGPGSTFPRHAQDSKIALREDFGSPAEALRGRGHKVAVGPNHRWHVLCAALYEAGVISAAASIGGAVAGR